MKTNFEYTYRTVEVFDTNQMRIVPVRFVYCSAELDGKQYFSKQRLTDEKFAKAKARSVARQKAVQRMQQFPNRYNGDFDLQDYATNRINQFRDDCLMKAEKILYNMELELVKLYNERENSSQ